MFSNSFCSLIGPPIRFENSYKTILEEYNRANELCSQASAMSPNEELASQLTELHLHISEFLQNYNV